jgi:hypothetical protein
MTDCAGEARIIQEPDKSLVAESNHKSSKIVQNGEPLHVWIGVGRHLKFRTGWSPNYDGPNPNEKNSIQSGVHCLSSGWL